MVQIEELLSYHKLKLLYSKYKLKVNDTFEGNMNGWVVTKGDWHIVTVDTNVDFSSGLDGGLALNCVGSYNGGTMEKEIELENYGEIIFEYHTENPKQSEEPNNFKFFIDNAVKLEVNGATPWQRCIPIGLTPGKHKLKFEYKFEGTPNEKKAIVDTIMIYEARNVNCLITEYNPPKPKTNINSNKILRGFTRYQEMTVADTEIQFTAIFDGLNFLDFIHQSNIPFYFVDEFGICYRGIFPESINPKSIAINQAYQIELNMIAGQKTGIGFC